MRELILRVPKVAVEDVLDELLPRVPGGVREVARGRDVELRMRGAELPGEAEIKQVVGRWPHMLTSRDVADDWRARRLDDYELEPIGGRLVVRPDWAPRAPRGLIDIALSESGAFGGGSHPTTRTCLEQLLRIAPCGAFADLGCGSGVLAIAASLLGWSPVTAVDVQPASVEAAAVNAALNGVAVEVGLLDLAEQSAPRANGIAANVPAPIHSQVAASLLEPGPRVALVSGFGPEDADAVSAGYAARGLAERRRVEAGHWTVVLLERD